jgi:2-iminobutanoate/2-iminopropanoate deaminase
LKEAGCTRKDVVKVTVFLTDMNDFAAVNEVYASFFPAPYPARTAFSVSGLPLGARVEIEAIAHFH